MATPEKTNSWASHETKRRERGCAEAFGFDIVPENYKVINLCSCLTEGRASLSAMSLSINNQCQDCLSQYVLLAAA